MEKVIKGIGHALRSLVPTAIWTIREGVLEWNDSDVTKPTDSVIEAEIIRLQAEWDVQEYAGNRKAEYPDWGSQLEKIYDSGIDKWKTEMVDPVKAKWPKDNSGPV